MLPSTSLDLNVMSNRTYYWFIWIAQKLLQMQLHRTELAVVYIINNISPLMEIEHEV